jgi:phosphoribosyl-dephospho-CoA transferase
MELADTATVTSPRPHDLLRLPVMAADFLADDAPSWTRRALRATPWVVVRRAAAPDGLIAVGVRGRERSHRYAWTVRQRDVLETVTPEDLADVGPPAARQVQAIQALSAVRAPLNDAGMAWGPTGSVGFELATGAPTATSDSDLDLVLRAPLLKPAALVRLAVLHHNLTRLGVRIDCQVETSTGAIALAELVSASRDVLVKTSDGPLLLQRTVAVP